MHAPRDTRVSHVPNERSVVLETKLIDDYEVPFEFSYWRLRSESSQRVCDWSTHRTRSGKVVGNCCLRGVASGYVTQTRNYVARNWDVKTVTRFFDVSPMLIIRSDRSAAGWLARRNLGAAFLDLRGGTLQPNRGEARLDGIV